MSGKAEWTELRIRTKLKAAELDAVLCELVKEGKISIVSQEAQASNRDLILLKSG